MGKLSGQPGSTSPGDPVVDAVGNRAEEHPNGQDPHVPTRRRRSAPGTRPVTRGVVRRIDPWSVLRLSALFYLALYLILLVAAVLLWTAATTTGLRDNVESFVADMIASGEFEFVAWELFRAGAVGGAILVVLGTGTNVMLAVLYNLISDVVGGVSIVAEERPSARGAREAEMVAEPELEPVRVLIPDAEPRQDLRPRPSQRPEPSGL